MIIDYLYGFIELKRRLYDLVGIEKPNYLFICLDSCRYDVFKQANAPNMKAIGQLKQAHSFACFTPSAMIGFLMNFPPIGLNISRLYPYKKWAWLPVELHKEGYKNAFFSPNAVLPLLDLNLKGSLLKEFDVKEFIKYDKETNVDEIVKDALSFFNENELIYSFLLLMETHTPIFDGEKAKIPYPIQNPKSVFDFQMKAVEFIDEKMGILFDGIRDSGRKTDVIITSDHGELLGPVQWGHNPGDLTFYNQSRITYSNELFEIPFIRGTIN
ncbi:MAG: sulfatase-like hydrolase/transferase [Candidatus Bathyarchaeota archaeon]|nr:sulfatase-like hydrolase/transferase [Candidatus Bathyarchaeota archaeon]